VSIICFAQSSAKLVNFFCIDQSKIERSFHGQYFVMNFLCIFAFSRTVLFLSVFCDSFKESSSLGIFS
jgi:hypothetical protein